MVDVATMMFVVGSAWIENDHLNNKIETWQEKGYILFTDESQRISVACKLPLNKGQLN